MAICNCVYENFCALFNGYEMCLPRPCRYRKDPSNFVEVVLCKDCIESAEYSLGRFCESGGYYVNDDFYCANGERK